MSLVTYEPIRMEHWWNDTDKGKLECSEENLSQCTFLKEIYCTESIYSVYRDKLQNCSL